MTTRLETSRLVATDEWLFVAIHSDTGPRSKATVGSRDLDRLARGEFDEALWAKVAFNLCMPLETLMGFLAVQQREARIRRSWAERRVKAEVPPEVQWQREAEAEVDAICTALKADP